MSIYRDIKKLTQIPYSEENASFIRQAEPNASKQYRRIHKPKPPRNANLYDPDNNDDDDDDDNSGNRKKRIPLELHENEIATSIREVSCGIDYSNESLEKHWKIRQETLGKSSTSSEDDLLLKTSFDGATSKTKPDEEKIDEEYILKQCKLNKNAAIRGLLKSQQISLNDLQIPSNVINESTQIDNIPSSSNVTKGKHSAALVQCPEDPDVFVRPLQAYGTINEKEYKDIDFSVPHIGKKKKVTPRQFYAQMDDSDFGFVKKDTKTKK